MIIKVNNEIRTVNDNMKLSDIIALSNAKGIAIAVNSRIIKKEKWESTYLNDGDEIIIIKAAYGG